MGYKVTANITGKRITSDKTFKKKSKAKAFADETNRFRPGSRARVTKA